MHRDKNFKFGDYDSFFKTFNLIFAQPVVNGPFDLCYYNYERINKDNPSQEKGRGKPSAETQKENPIQLGIQPQHALALFKTTKKNLVEATRFGVGCKNAGRIPSLDCDHQTSRTVQTNTLLTITREP